MAAFQVSAPDGFDISKPMAEVDPAIRTFQHCVRLVKERRINAGEHAHLYNGKQGGRNSAILRTD